MADRRDEKPADFLLPETVKSWFSHMYTHLISGNVAEMARLYDREFHNLTNNYFKQASWPEPSAVESLVDEDPTFLLLYKQIYFRHLFSRLQPGMDMKVASWETYVAIFDGVLDGSLELEALPSQWVFDIVGEFVYQYQSYCQFRAKVATKGEQEIASYSENLFIWDTSKVLGYLHALVRHSKIVEILKEEEGVRVPSEVVKELGYFSLITLARAHVLFGDYYTSLKLLEPIDLFNKSSRGEAKTTAQIHEKSPGCHVSVFYHMGFAQLMLEDFAAAIRSFSTIILQVNRNRNYYSRFADYEQLHKLTEKAMALLAIALFLCPGQRVNDQIHSLIREKYGDKQSKLQKGDISALTELFGFSCPKFILPAVAVEGEGPVNRSAEASQRQQKAFNDMVTRQQHIPAVRSYIKLYRSIDLEKLAAFRGVDVELARAELMALKVSGSRLKSDVHFFLNNNLVLIDEETSNQRTGEFFINHIHKFARIVDECVVSQ
ncbi:eukaryotic translation initiation factor 3 subunit E-interacting protein, putative [Phytophthora infestans T30-4]|uniref:Eukaryotic translation initiation factor 3 subunit L n=2 Tax=Phytophthora infestans TaxID=4787 RepID=D0NVK9_PHYIT|nr:eukaryotic translation initiation factor 3 subunit E-interacting protein, putative [Phytophthora infestans T30-4]EEY66690.1 eukaryotic translation initiation factor 3 subunit E-interacting protein, putative [Phytophthora infestans T30-4]KAF4045186.1 RNA polymerase I-associated factor PAF67 [Phytophthora infestans]KAF4145826.1 RNA polymerase I-associated factor PAF67 [Phytophthora infestans]|eukprot:XP_002896755.1 eukaryotic translation initiation factor 3 subunit E-interacting protein, putative [Phytophthora infestans T30-4]